MKTLKKISYSDFVYLFILILLCVAICNLSMLYATFPFLTIVLGKIKVFTRLGLVFLAALYYCKYNVSVKQIIVFFLYLMVVAFEYIMSKHWLMFDIFFITIFFPKILNYEKIINLFFYSLIIGSIIIIILYNLDFFKYYVFYNGREYGIKRPHFGFGHPNRLGKTLMAIVFLYLLKQKRKINIINVIVVLAIVLFTYVYPNSLSSSFTMLITLFVVLVLQNFKVNRQFLICLIYIVLFLMIALTLYFTLSYKGMGIASKLPNTFSSRFSLGLQGINEYGIHLFGVRGIETANEVLIDILDSESKYFVVDNLILHILIFSGIIPLVIFICVYIICICKNFNNHNYVLLSILFALIFYSVTEAGIIDFILNFVFICSICYVDNKSVIKC